LIPPVCYVGASGWEKPAWRNCWRKRLGEAGVIKPASIKRVIVDTTVMAKVIAPPIDSALLEKSRVLLVKAVRQYGLSLRQNYNRLAPRLLCQVAQYAHARQFKRMRRALRALRSRERRVQRDIEWQRQRVPPDVRGRLDELLGRTRRILQQRPKDKNKLYALHAPEVECISKGKARVRYEYGVKVSIVTTLKEGLVVGARSMPGNPYDGHTLHEALEQAAILSDVEPEMVFVDRGYKGVDVEHVQIWRSRQKRGVTRGLKSMIRRRSAIEPTIGHMKNDCKLDRNWLKGTLGDALNAVLCGARHNIRLIINKLRVSSSKAIAY
jgi:IS5 family transposase